ncbi:DUF6350 family protein [Pseudactinotalea sp. Z1739]|uniref:cell division protein PerM n=1 Tax=Pseudactinotalea sp. Z1739 TaxID=3413028 RepID=UPI003C7B490B
MTTTARPPSYQPRLIEHVGDHGQSGRAIRLPAQWLRGLLAGAEALMLGWLVLVVPAIATYIATAASPALGSAGWVEAAQMGTAGWFLAHGASLHGADAVISVTPLGLTVLYTFLVSAAVRRARLVNWAPVLVAICTYVALGALLLALATPPGAPFGLIGAGGVAVVGSVWGMRGRYPRAPGALARWRLPQWLRLAGRATWRATAALLAVATALLIVAVALGFDQIVQIQRSLQADPVSTVVIVLAQVLLLPVLIVWALAFLLGPGFTVGAGTLFSTSGIESGPLPVIPVLGALPEPDSLAGSLPLTAGAGVVVGLLVGWWLLRGQRQAPLWQPLAGAVLAVLATAALVGGLGWLTSGGVGPGAMAVTGPEPFRMALAVAWQVGSGATVAVIGLHPGTHRALVRLVRWVRAQVGAQASAEAGSVKD